jgi:UDP:flavonoid glycosyltransferase YjiC (YdhE family)
MRILFATTRGAGHVGPLVPFARACERAGHSVLVAGPRAAGSVAAQAGLPFRAVGEPPAADVAAAWEPVWSPATSPGAAFVIRDLFIGLHARVALPGMLAAMEDWRPDVVVRETCEFSSGVAAERFGIPVVQCGIHLTASTDTDGRLIALAAPALDDLRASAGISRASAPEGTGDAPVLTLAPRALEDPGFSEPPHLHRFGAPPAHDAAALPPWPARPDAPLVYLSFGSEAPATAWFPRLYRECVDALADLPVRLLVTIGRTRTADELGAVAPWVRVAPWVPQADVMGDAAAMVTHGGSGSALAALAAGVPQTIVPLFVDGEDNGRRVARAGAGIALEHGYAAVPRLAEAVRALLEDPAHRRAARRMAGEIAAMPPVDEAVGVLEAAAGRSEAVAGFQRRAGRRLERSSR